MNANEKRFFKLKTGEKKTLIFNPCWFYFSKKGIGTVRYRPDFYCNEEDCYYEVAGTKQAYNQNKDKYLLMAAFYPEIIFQVITPEGHSYTEKVIENRFGSKIHPLLAYLTSNGITAKRFAEQTKINESILSRLMSGTIKCTQYYAERLSKGTGLKIKAAELLCL